MIICAYGVSSVHFPWDSIEDTFEQCLKAGFDFIEFFTDKFTDSEAERVRRLSRETGVRVGYHAPYTGDYDLGINSKETLLSRIEEILHIAVNIQAEYIVTHLGTYENRDYSLGHVVDFLNEQVAPQLAKHGIPLGIENFTLCHGDKALGDRVSDFEYVFSRVASPLIKLTIDYGHAHITRDVNQYLQYFGDRLISVHIADNDATDDQHAEVGKGTIPWEAVIADTLGVGFRGPFIIECDNPVASVRRIRKAIEKG